MIRFLPNVLICNHSTQRMRLLIVLWAILELSVASQLEFVDPNCPDYDLSLVCTSKCDDQYLQCVSACSDADCLMECNRAAVSCADACPCHTDCLGGCNSCNNPICFCNDTKNDDNLDACVTKTSKNLGQCILNCNDNSSCETACVVKFKSEHSECPCQEKCPLGCPCDNYDCDLPEKKAILALYTRSSSTPSVLIQPNGGITDGFEFKMDDDTEVYRSCSATLNGDFFVFGGSSTSNKRRNQVSKVIGCELKRIGDLNYEFYQGACGTFLFPKERIFLCFASNRDNKCESYDGFAFRIHANSTNPHHSTSLANHDGSPFVVGSLSPHTNKTETYNITTGTWTELEDYPYHGDISGYGTVTTSQGVLIIGGISRIPENVFVATVACYNANGWSRLDDLQSTRRGHRAIINGDKVYVVGGEDTQLTEIWSTDEKSKSIQLSEPQLHRYYYYPALFVVDTTYCVKP